VFVTLLFQASVAELEDRMRTERERCAAASSDSGETENLRIKDLESTMLRQQQEVDSKTLELNAQDLVVEQADDLLQAEEKAFEGAKEALRATLKSLLPSLAAVHASGDWVVLSGLLTRRIVSEHNSVMNCLSRLRARPSACDDNGNVMLGQALAGDFGNALRK
jgi:hypothetical protein